MGRGGLKEGAVGAPSVPSQGRCLQKGGASGKTEFQRRVCAQCTRASPGTRGARAGSTPAGGGGEFGSTLAIWGEIIVGFFPPCFVSFPSLFSARAGFMSHIKNILIPGHY